MIQIGICWVIFIDNHQRIPFLGKRVDRVTTLHVYRLVEVFKVRFLHTEHKPVENVCLGKTYVLPINIGPVLLSSPFVWEKRVMF